MARQAPVINYAAALRTIESVDDRVLRAKLASLISWDASEQLDALNEIKKVAATMRPSDLEATIHPHLLRALLERCGYSSEYAAEKVK